VFLTTLQYEEAAGNFSFETTLAFRAPLRMRAMAERTVVKSKHFHAANTMREIL